MTGSPPVRRIVTGHDAAGRAVFTADDLLPVSPLLGFAIGLALGAVGEESVGPPDPTA